LTWSFRISLDEKIRLRHQLRVDLELNGLELRPQLCAGTHGGASVLDQSQLFSGEKMALSSA
jgi:hypothetical protein